jgi:hypothetical protein
MCLEAGENKFSATLHVTGCLVQLSQALFSHTEQPALPPNWLSSALKLFEVLFPSILAISMGNRSQNIL